MRQVPHSPFTGPQTFFFPLIIGRGKLAAHLHHYFHLVDFPHKHYDHSIHGPFESLSTEALAELDRKLLACNAIWLMVSDQAIAPVLEKVKKRIVHLGRNPDKYDYLHSSAATRIEGMTTFHPLMTFGRELYTREQYEAIPFATFEGETLRPLAFPLKNPHFNLPTEQREFYHACAVMMSNLPVLLWSQVSKAFETRLDQDSNVFKSILKQTLDNFLQQGRDALTGPIARNDRSTIQKNLASIEGTPLYPIYQSFLPANPIPNREETP